MAVRMKQPETDKRDTLICGSCGHVENSILAFVDHKRKCENERIKGSYKEFLVGSLKIELPHKISDTILKDYASKKLDLKQSGIEPLFIERGCILVWLQINLGMFLDWESLNEAVERIVLGIGKRYCYSKPSYNFQMYKLLSGTESYLQDSLQCGNCRYTTPTLKEFLCHKREEMLNKEYLKLQNCNSFFCENLMREYFCWESRTTTKNIRFQAEQEQSVPNHMKGKYQAYLEEWRKDEETFKVTRATNYVANLIEKNNVVVVTGISGCGKTSIIHHVALKLNKDEGYDIIPFVTGPADILNYRDINKNQVFVTDDICGKNFINEQDLQTWKEHTDKIKQLLPSKENNGKMKILVSCRLHIFKDKKFKSMKMFTEQICELQSEKHCLFSTEKRNMIQKYITLSNHYFRKYDTMLAGHPLYSLLCKMSKGKQVEQLTEFFIGDTLPYCACEAGHTDIVKLLLDKNVDLSQCSILGWTPLFIACGWSHTEIVELLLDRIFDPSHKDWFGRTPLDEARN